MSVASPLRLSVGGRVVDIQVAHPDDREAARAITGGFAHADLGLPIDARCVVSRDGQGRWEVGLDGAITHLAATLDGALLALEWLIVSDLLTRKLDRFHLHGAALADPSQTMTVLVLGDSGVGKTTLTLALMAKGFQPFADDVVLLDPETLVPERFPRAFHVDETTRALVAPLFGGTKWEQPGLPSGYCLPVDWARSGRPVGAIVFPNGHDRVHPQMVEQSLPEATLTLLSFTTTLDHAPALALRTAARLTASAPSYALHGGPLAATVDLVTSTIVARAKG